MVVQPKGVQTEHTGGGHEQGCSTWKTKPNIRTYKAGDATSGKKALHRLHEIHKTSPTH